MTQSFGSRPGRCCAPRVLIAMSATTPSKRSASHGSRLLVRLSGVADRDAADALRRSVFVVDAADLPPIDEADTYYDHQLEGLRVRTIDGREIGVVAEVLHTAGGELLAVNREEGGELLVPFVVAIVTSVSLEDGVVEIDPPEGLLELEN